MKKILFLFLSFLALLQGADFLMPEEAFIPSAKLEQNKIEVNIKLGESIHVYKDSLKFSLKSDTLALGGVKFPAPIIVDKKEVYEHNIALSLPLLKKKEFQGEQSVKLNLSFQGCSDKGLCYEPIDKEYTFNVAGSSLQAKKAATAQPKNATNETDQIANSFKNDNIFVVLLTFFGFGLLLSLTPCIFPMIPILSSIIVSQGEGMSAKRGFFLSLIYVLSMASAYTIAGVLAGLFGSNLQAAMQDPYVVISFSVIFVALAFSMFGFYEIGLPSSIQSRLSRVSDDASSKGGILGVAIMGFLSALIVGPCVAPPLAGTLVYIGQTGDAFLGGIALFVMSLGMGVPLMLIGIGAGKFMPRPGGWMTNVTKVFGVVMLAIAIWMLEKIAPPHVITALWAVLFIISSIYLGVLEPLGEKRGWNAFLKGIGVILLAYGVSLFIGVLSGNDNMLRPFDKFTAKCATNNPAKGKLKFKIVQSLDQLEPLLKKNKGKKVMLDFAAKWCTSCKELDEITFQDGQVQNALDEYVLIRADVTQNNTQTKALAKKYGVFGPPAVLFFDESGNILEDKRIIGYKPPQEFLNIMK